MSYILDALRRSESERQQGRVPDLAHSVQMVHKPKRRAIPVGAWVALALFFNGAILAIIFWPGSGFLASTVDEHVADPAPVAQNSAQGGTAEVEQAPVEQPTPETASNPELQQAEAAQPAPTKTETADVQEQNTVKPALEPMLVTPPSDDESEVYPEAQAGPAMSEQPTLIVPSYMGGSSEDDAGSVRELAPSYDFADGPPVQHLVEKPLAFQRSIPDLRFSSHIYASDPAARRVMINDNYLRPGDSFSGIRVEAITADGVVLSAYGETFRVGVVRDWVSPR